MSEISVDPEGFVTGPHRVDTPHPELPAALADLWGRVTVAGGCVGFKPTDEVDRLRSVAEELVEDVRNRRANLLTIGQQHVLVGAAVLRARRMPVYQHTGELVAIAVDPVLDGKGWDKQLHDAALVQAQAMGLQQLDTAVPAGHALEDFYREQGWRERGRWPGAAQLAEDDRRDLVWFTREV
ncbi:GNAT family N-acetyltransferase [Saccharopolyspora rectivirgula]|uniref:GNAT family N-acetyltransferase n=1 Tax=Saccharopolyspora rectivirgula TaxID=28042 RepID=UPI00240A75B5|nr:GNAT family N-acetyltransferase [Saccharopolyspora rectivirgula]